MPADTYIRAAIAAHRAGRHEEAEALYLRLLEVDPDDVDALHFLGLLHHQLGSSEAALRLIGRSVELAPDYVDARCNLGNVLKAAGRNAEAREHYARALELESEHPETLNSLGLLLRRTGDYAGALARFADALRARPDWAEVEYNRGATLEGLGRPQEAIEALRRALELNPALASACMALARLVLEAGDRASATALYQQVLRLDPDHPTARHMLAAVTGEGIPGRATPAHMRQLFGEFAESFEVQLDRLGYRGPALVGAELTRRLGAPAHDLAVLDLGCGTGLCGPVLAPYAATLAGVDLSPDMLERAHRSGVYTVLYEDDLLAFLGQGAADAWDLVVSADTLIYFGILDEVIDTAARCLRPGGLLVFTLEQPTVPGADVALLHHGRYGHSESYVRAVLEAAGFADVAVTSSSPRRERRQDVAGWLVSARRADVA